ncbi:MAG: COG1615 family transporter, partial [Desulfobacteraceae bacterium]|nr:COG1615 family transporter [Desulfobacteraceae bacterium]
MSKKFMIIGFGIIAVLLLLSGISIYPDYLWFENLGFSPVFWTMLLSRFGFGSLVWVLLVLIIFANLYVAKRLSPGDGRGLVPKAADGYVSQLGLSSRTLNSLLIAFILILSFMVASKGSYQWDMVLRFLKQQPFGSTDPIFNKDMGFYIFSLPLYVYIRSGLIILFVLAGLVTVGWYLKNGAVQVEGDFGQAEGPPTAFPKITISAKARKHLIFLGGIIVLLLAWGYHLKAYGVLYSTQGPAFGASYT